MANRMQIKNPDRDLELFIGAVSKEPGQPASAGYEVFAKWDEDIIIRKLKSRMLDKFYSEFDVKPWIADYKKLRKAKDKFFKFLEESVREIVDEFKEETGA